MENLGQPFLIADEMVFYIPKGGQVVITKDQFKLLFVLKGEILHDLDGLAEHTLLKEGDVLVCPGFRQHRFTNPDPARVRQLHVMRLFLDGEAIRKCAHRRVRRPENNLSDFVYHHFNRTVQFVGGIDGEIIQSLNALRRETEQRGIGYRHRARSLCTDLLISVARKLGECDKQQEPRGKNGASHLVAASKEYILKNLDAKLTLGEIAWYAGKGEEHLARVFKRETGQSVFDYVREMRVNQAKTYLLDSSLSLTRIAGLCGFSSLSFFSRTFSELVGISPSAYRQHIETSVLPHPAGQEG